MGFGLRFKEKIKQVGKKGSQPDKNGFVPTNYERVQLTYDEATAFAESLKLIRKRIADAQAARSKMLREVETVLTGSLPRIHEIDLVTGEHTTAEASPEDHSSKGDYVHTGTLTRLAEENEIKVQQQVYDPIDKWISEVDLFKGKMKILENLRLELDGSRRDHILIENKIAKQEAKAHEVDAKHTTHIQSKDASVAGKRTAFEQYEAQLYEELVNLIGESGMLHSALDRSINLEIEIYERAKDPIALTTARLETLSSGTGASPVGTPVSGVSSANAGGYGQPVGSAGVGGYSAQTVAPSGGYGTQTGSGGYGTQTGSGGYGSQTSPVSHNTELPSVPQTKQSTPTGTSGTGGSGVAYERPYAA